MGDLLFKTVVLLFLLFCISACTSQQHSRAVQRSDDTKEKHDSINQGFICHKPQQFAGRVIGNGHCVSLIQYCSAAPLTKEWRQGSKVKGLSLQAGSIIATFNNGRYPNKTGWHAAIYISQDEDGIWVWDQWVGKPVHRRLIRFKGGQGSANNDGDAYSVVY